MKEKIGEGMLLYFLKFTDYPDSLLDGEIYMGTLKNYIEMEKVSGEKGRGDKFEAAQVFNDLDVTISTYDSGEVVAKGKAANLNIRFNGDENRPVYCLFALTDKHFKYLSEDDENMNFILDIKEDVIQHMLGKFSGQLVLLNATEFLKRFVQKSREKGYSTAHGFVVYDDYAINNSKRVESYFERNQEVFFWKDKYFEKQNEYRLVVLDQEVEEALKVQIGDLNDIGKNYDAKEFLAEGFELTIPKRIVSELKEKLQQLK
jgi:hypothetical protein